MFHISVTTFRASHRTTFAGGQPVKTLQWFHCNILFQKHTSLEHHRISHPVLNPTNFRICPALLNDEGLKCNNVWGLHLDSQRIIPMDEIISCMKTRTLKKSTQGSRTQTSSFCLWRNAGLKKSVWDLSFLGPYPGLPPPRAIYPSVKLP